MCEDNAFENLIGFNFAGFSDEVENALAFKSRNSDPRVKPYYSQILYSWYISRSDYRNGELIYDVKDDDLNSFAAALTMYLRSRKIQDLGNDTSGVIELAEQQREACMIAINALSLLSRPSAWFTIPLVADTGREVSLSNFVYGPAIDLCQPRKRRKLSKHMPEERFAAGKQDSEVVDLADIQYEYALLSARLDLHRVNQATQSSSVGTQKFYSNLFNILMHFLKISFCLLNQ